MEANEEEHENLNSSFLLQDHVNHVRFSWSMLNAALLSLNSFRFFIFPNANAELPLKVDERERDGRKGRAFNHLC